MDQTMFESYRKQYREQGFFVVPELLNSVEIQRFREVIDALMERSCEVRKSDAVFDLEADHSRKQPRVRRIKAADGNAAAGGCAGTPALAATRGRTLRIDLRSAGGHAKALLRMTPPSLNEAA